VNGTCMTGGQQWNPATIMNIAPATIIHRYPAFDKIPELASRLGVAPVALESSEPKWLMEAPDGSRYDICQFICAILDRLDKL
jgi:hypothetical protein